MFWAIQLVLMILGVGLALRKELRVGRRVARAPTPFFVGLILILQLPVAQMTSLLVGASAWREATLRGQDEVSAAEAAVVRDKSFWLNAAVPAGAALVAGVFLVLGLKDPAPRPRPADSGDLFSGVA